MYRASPKDGVAWITGASAGIGRAVALELVCRGWRVVATARSEDRLGSLAAEAAALGGNVMVRPGDVTDRPGMAALVAKIESEDGPIALAMLNAGGFFPDSKGEFIGKNFRKTLELNCDGTINCLEFLLPAMLGRRRGQIGVVASVAGYRGLPTVASYCMAKAGLIAMCESLKMSLDTLGVTIQMICPGFVRTELALRAPGPKPFMIEVDDAARRICDGFERGGFEIAFPRRMVWGLKLAGLLPHWLYFAILSRASRQYL